MEFNISHFSHGEGQSRFNRDGVPRSWETQGGGGGGWKRRECGRWNQGVEAGEGFIEGNGREGKSIGQE
jgi:hypothetical protein